MAGQMRLKSLTSLRFTKFAVLLCLLFGYSLSLVHAAIHHAKGVQLASESKYYAFENEIEIPSEPPSGYLNDECYSCRVLNGSSFHVLRVESILLPQDHLVRDKGRAQNLIAFNNSFYFEDHRSRAPPV